MKINVEISFKEAIKACCEEAAAKEGAYKAIDSKGIKMDELIAIIRTAESEKAALETLKSKFNLSEKEAKTIMEMELTELSEDPKEMAMYYAEAEKHLKAILK